MTDAASFDELLAKYTAKMDENRRLRERIERLREALRPFADLGFRPVPGTPDGWIVNIPRATDIRAARAAMGESDE